MADIGACTVDGQTHNSALSCACNHCRYRHRYLVGGKCADVRSIKLDFWADSLPVYEPTQTQATTIYNNSIRPPVNHLPPCSTTQTLRYRTSSMFSPPKASTNKSVARPTSGNETMSSKIMKPPTLSKRKDSMPSDKAFTICAKRANRTRNGWGREGEVEDNSQLARAQGYRLGPALNLMFRAPWSLDHYGPRFPWRGGRVQNAREELGC